MRGDACYLGTMWFGLRPFAAALGLVLSLATSAAKADEGPQSPPKTEGAEAPRVELALHRATLPNGLRVVVAPDGTCPVVAVSVAFALGEADAEAGATAAQTLNQGLATAWIRTRGGRTEIDLRRDALGIIDVVPQNELDLALWAGLARMRKAREPNLSLATEPVETSDAARVLGVVFQSGERALELDARSLLNERVTPANLVVTVVGAVDADDALQRIEAVWGEFSGPAAKVSETVEVAEQRSPRTVVIRDPSASRPRLTYGWPLRAADPVERAAAEMGAEILAGGRASRLGALGFVGAATISEDSRGRDALLIAATPATLGPLSNAERTIEREIRRLAQQGPTAAELSRAARRLRARRIAGLVDAASRAAWLGYVEITQGDARHVASAASAYERVTTRDVAKAVATHLTQERTTVLETLPKEPDPPPKSEKKPAKPAPKASPPKASAEPKASPEPKAPKSKGPAKKGAGKSK